jgi:hypothetical protein
VAYYVRVLAIGDPVDRRSVRTPPIDDQGALADRPAPAIGRLSGLANSR